MTSIDLEKIWLWIGDETRAHEEIEDKTISPEDGVAYVNKWLSAVSSQELFSRLASDGGARRASAG